jgi:hypothetical protein
MGISEEALSSFNAYKVLGISGDAGDEEVFRAYQALKLKDKAAAEKAYALLSTAALRLRYQLLHVDILEKPDDLGRICRPRFGYIGSDLWQAVMKNHETTKK